MNRLPTAIPVLTSALILVGLFAGPAGAQHPDRVHVPELGSLAFPNSGSEAAQDPFVRGVLLLHSFEFGPAAEAFRRAQAEDPTFALAFWGEAMTYNHPLWQEQDRDAALEALGRLAPDPAGRRARAGTEREALYMDAIEVLYGTGGETPGTKTQRDQAYMRAMGSLLEAFPEDDEARAFYSLAILGSKDGSRDFATYMRAAAVAQPVFDRNPDHPGAAHYLIHSFDDPIHAPLGLPAADAYAEIAPEAAHAQHMTTHIFVAMGMWDRVVTGNIRARDTQDRQRAERGLPPNVCGHYSSWLHYGHLQREEWAEAEALMGLCHERMFENPNPSEKGYFAAMRARHAVDGGDLALAARWNAPEGLFAGAISAYQFTYPLTDAFVGLWQGDEGAARELLAESWPESGILEFQRTQLLGLLALREGRVEEGLDLLADAALAEDGLPFEFGPPIPVKPTFELLGEALEAQGRTEDAAAAFARALERTPGRTLSVRGWESTMADPNASGR